MAQVCPEAVALTTALLFSTALKTAIERCWFCAGMLFDHASFEMFTMSSAPFLTKSREI
jgi:hypothetical protein